jgi:hypothetical protein
MKQGEADWRKRISLTRSGVEGDLHLNRQVSTPLCQDSESLSIKLDALGGRLVEWRLLDYNEKSTSSAASIKVLYLNG